jgi:hypothetical protein
VSEVPFYFTESFFVVFLFVMLVIESRILCMVGKSNTLQLYFTESLHNRYFVLSIIINDQTRKMRAL